MNTTSTPAGIRKLVAQCREGKNKAERCVRHEVALVPTMGALHEGHLSLIRAARRSSRIVVVSIYVNPAQFGPEEDFSRYPRPKSLDLKLCQEEGVDAVFAPLNLYPKDASTWVEEGCLSQGGEGDERPGHFRGVCTVVLKLFNCVQPDAAFFGQKDAQQAEVIKRMVRDLDVPIRIVVCPTIRDQDGLAMSSRNVYLTPKQRTHAQVLPQVLKEARCQADPVRWANRQLQGARGIKVDYVKKVGNRLTAAIRVGQTRLLDNVPWPGKLKP